MSIPPLVSEDDPSPKGWQRKVSSLLNLTVRRLMDIGATADRPAKPVVSQQRFNTTTGKPEWWNGTSWVTW